MAKLNLLQCLIAFLCVAAMLFSETSATTDVLDVQSLQDLYFSLNFPPQLTGWEAYGGDPCLQGWKGISCNGNSIHSINLSGLGITGFLGQQLSNLHSLKELDASFNSIHGDIPFNLPPNASYINLSHNQLSGTIPPLASMKYLTVLNLSHNSFFGPIGDIFTGLLNLKQMDLSYNSFFGDLPISFTALTNLTVLSLQNNQFTGSVNYLANLPLIELNIQNNHFTGIVPKNVLAIPKLSMDENLFEMGVPLFPHSTDHNMSTALNGSNISMNQSSAANNDPSLKVDAHKHKRWGRAVVGSAVGAAVFVVSCSFAIIAVLIHLSHKHQLEGFPISLSSFSRTTTNAPSESSWQCSTAPPLSSQMPPSSAHSGSNGRAEKLPGMLSDLMRSRAPATAKRYSIAELLVATDNFIEDNLIKESSLGSVYKGTLINGQIVAVKIMNMVPLSIHEEDQFLEVVWNMSSLRHPNIVSLLGYCMEHQQYLIVYEYAGHLSLKEALHFAQETASSLSWNNRVRIAIGVARALAYLHLKCSPPIAHGNIKASAVLLDEEFNPHISECGLVVLRPLTHNEIMPDSKLPSGGLADTTSANMKCDIYAYGVLLLELLTGQKPFDSSRGRNKRSLVKWAATQLHEFGSLEEMVDPTIGGNYSPRVLLRFTEAIRICTQMEPELRPPISEVVELLGIQI